MDEIFRFLMLRPPQTGNALEVRPSKAFGTKLSRAQTNVPSRTRSALKALAVEWLASAQRIDSVDALAFGKPLAALVDRALQWQKPDFDDLHRAIESIFGSPLETIAQSGEFHADHDRIADHLVSAKLVSHDEGVAASQLERLYVLGDMLLRAAAKDEDLTAPGGVRRALTRPTTISFGGRAEAETPPKGSDPPKRDSRIDDLRRRAEVIDKLMGRLSTVNADQLTRPNPSKEDADDGHDPFARLRSQLVDKLDLETLARLPLGAAGQVRHDVDALTPASRDTIAPRGAQSSLILNRTAAAQVNQSERKVLREAGVDLASAPLPAALNTLGMALRETHAQLATLDAPEDLQYAMVGTNLVPLSGTMTAYGGTMSALSVPTTHSDLKPVGVGDLLVVRQQLKRYEGGELAHVENILKGEFKTRLHERSRETEQTTTIEVETQKDEERDTQTTERFELQREASQVLKEDMSLKAGLSVSGSYGPTVEFKAYADMSMDRAKEESSKTASSYSKEVTSRASTKVSERQRSEQILRTLEVFKEKNEHGFDNKAGTGHVVGVYQWIDKVYEAQVFNYGKRMLFDLMVPEPGAFWIYANATQPAPGATLTRPSAFTLTPDQISESNYATYVQRYQVAGVKPPPEPYSTVSKTFDGTISKDDHGSTSKIAELPIPAGYRALTGHAIATASSWEDDWQVAVAVGREYWARAKSGYVNNYFTLDNETDSIPVAVRTFHVATFVVSIEVNCQRTDRALQAWRLETHAAIQQAYLKLERDYQDQLAALETAAANAVQGRNPAENRRIERNEIKKLAISALTAQHYDLFGAIGTSPQGYPQPDLTEAEAEGRYIRFFEQAFEWEQMMYLFYPYFWGRKSKWRSQALLQDVDTQFADFLRAGAARAVLPVRPGFEAAIAHFLDTGEIWEGADPPTLTSPLYVSIVQEIKERDQAKGDEVAQGDPWDVRIPTTLVKLRPADDLPQWQKQSDGTWVPV
ncbi:hypothetical protein ARC20_10160 [Stenotrophomonas panacihumi]|uniref:Uncharacterized protein n=1 Tax=Stenotrophomonas panacihumi TaxID=676599 RepID=A0A0R0AEI2_9GAMM|nr:hypothetical protein [Stenotrophomonas panacihumi]KRG43141.1 hypothetical protein ARC20_10160 [Stenotrophomonas panacihumi]PTN53931.1 hypothetical protein C9J98_13075 [Stenotrophomonas panacihumi]